MLHATGLTKRYGSTTALAGLDLTVGPGEIVGLIGHNGAGKTTFVEITAGLTRPDAGTVEIAGIDAVRHPAAARRHLGLAPQHLALYPSASVRQNLTVFGGLAGLRRRALRAAIDEVATATELTDVLDRPVGLLSGGQQRRTQTATALLHRPAVLLLDEPTVGADPQTRQAMLAVVRQRADAGVAVCYTTHYLPELDELGATLAVLRAGRVIARGTRDELLTGLPGELLLGYTDGTERRISSTDPRAELAAAVTDPTRTAGLSTVDIRRPSLDDLYHALSQEAHHVAA
ncbi:ABC transporter ATP-binding protein [Actinocatenispora sera]|uniref:Daunorubicin resistance protein DrrA family ABC transporter ATP-binding protein n=1 Tax=Actinocatenispora sera TaxID=390989 RepID=A0A810LBF0_9ACTN|nr:ABC transporter ATP-binding protein [Actinocatenispora sera]BCJ31348.1 daunorubicin resistance protein DrrA family ABC transporter ATP-binding protein [Actinocatenispora sera]